LWRWLELEARIAADQGDRRQALALLEQALAAYPPAAYADPTRHSRFQHLANDLGLLVWDDDGFEAAVRAFADLLAKDERCHYFHDEPWERRLAREPKAAEKRKALRDAIRAAYERRAERFPAHAERARAYARALR
jgi:tetratricopeptide (TPR) repeat protein